MLGIDLTGNAYRAGQVLSAACTDGSQASCEELRVRFKDIGPAGIRSRLYWDILKVAPPECGYVMVYVRCEVAATGKLEGCAVESPDSRIYLAAQAVVERTVLDPATVDGYPFMAPLELGGSRTLVCGSRR